VTRASTPVATDALFTLKAAVSLVTCKRCDCDTDNSGAVTAADALRILNAAVGVNVPLVCQ
jgi:hypothetical protein